MRPVSGLAILSLSRSLQMKLTDDYSAGKPDAHKSPVDERYGLVSSTIRRQADFFCGKLNGITFPYSPGGVHFLAFFLKLLGMKNSMILAINHPTLVRTRLRRKSFSF